MFNRFEERSSSYEQIGAEGKDGNDMAVMPLFDLEFEFVMNHAGIMKWKQMENKMNKLINTKGVSRMTGLSESTLTKLRMTGGGPKFIKLGRSVVYDPSDVEAWIDNHRVSSTSEASRK